jgi:hypothetical protein
MLRIVRIPRNKFATGRKSQRVQKEFCSVHKKPLAEQEQEIMYEKKKGIIFFANPLCYWLLFKFMNSLCTGINLSDTELSSLSGLINFATT